jgi:hypothetical protein
MKKTVFILLAPACIFFATGCKKESYPREVSTFLSAVSSSNAVTEETKFGILVNGETGDDKITVVNKTGTTYVRDAIILESYNGKAPMMDKYQSEGFKVLLNLNNSHVSESGQKQPNAYPTDMVKYKKNLENVLNKYKPEIAVIENEPANDGRYTGPIEDYFTELQTAIEVCKARGIKIADGGLHTGMVCILLYQEYLNHGLQKRADAFAELALTDNYLRAAQGRGSAEINAKIEKAKKMIAAYKSMDLDYVNIHWYEPLDEDNDPTISAPGAAKEVADYLRWATGKPVITNEFGQDNQLPSLITSMVNEFRTAGLSYAIVYSGAGISGAQPLHEGTNLLPNGIAYRDVIAQ